MRLNSAQLELKLGNNPPELLHDTLRFNEGTMVIRISAIQCFFDSFFLIDFFYTTLLWLLLDYFWSLGSRDAHLYKG